MKITIDTTFSPHRVEIEGDCSIGELIEFLSKYYPDFTWKDVRIVGKIGTWTGTGVTTPYLQSPNPWINPGTTPWKIGDFPGTSITYCSDNNNFMNSNGDIVNVTSLINEKGKS